MKNIEKLLLSKEALIKDAMQAIDEGACKIALVVDESMMLLGTITDGDIRRAILNGISLEKSIEDTYCKTPIVGSTTTSRTDLLNLADEHRILRIPIIDEKGKLIALDTLEELRHASNKPNKVVLMVGGLGTRLRPLTNNVPKPMLHVGGKPILETIIKKFVDHGFTHIVLCVNYKSEIIRNHFGSGEKFGATIEYVYEDKRMGTAGALTLLKEKPTEPFFVMNGDLLTDINFESLLDYHTLNKSMGTMCVREYDFQVPFGVVNLDGHDIKSIVEKPIHNFFVSAGIYMLDPLCIDLIPKDEFYDMPTLFDVLIQKGKNVISFPLSEYWLDIGRLEEYEKANNEYHGVFS